jgi:hypothetical protein
MSAYQVSNKHITALIANVCQIRFMGDRLFDGDGQVEFYWNNERQCLKTAEAGQLLADECSRSVDSRYNNHAEVEPFEIVFPGRLSALDILKLANGYSYQACETEDWGQTKAHALLEFIKAAATRALPGYEDAAWSL